MAQYREKPVVVEAELHRGAPLSIATLEGDMLAQDGDYIITGVKGERYPCKPDIFEATYDLADGPLDFGGALRELKAGKRVAREGWNGRGMFLAYMPGFTIPAGMVNGRTAKYVPAGQDVECGGYIAMWTAQGVWQPGWLASQADMLAEDWIVLDG